MPAPSGGHELFSPDEKQGKLLTVWQSVLFISSEKENLQMSLLSLEYQNANYKENHRPPPSAQCDSACFQFGPTTSFPQEQTRTAGSSLLPATLETCQATPPGHSAALQPQHLLLSRTLRNGKAKLKYYSRQEGGTSSPDCLVSHRAEVI